MMIQMVNTLELVAQFHTLFQHPIQHSPVMTPRAQLRIDLIQEELNELQQAVSDGNMVEVADALVDLQYVLSGAVLEFGLADIFSDMFMHVHQSNMTKACMTEQEAQETVQYYLEHKGREAHYEHRDGSYFVYRTSDNKALKSINYTPANLSSFVS